MSQITSLLGLCQLLKEPVVKISLLFAGFSLNSLVII